MANGREVAAARGGSPLAEKRADRMPAALVSALLTCNARTQSGSDPVRKGWGARWGDRRISLEWAVCSGALALAADAATYALIGISIAFSSTTTHSDLAVASQEMKPLRDAAIWW